MYSYFSQLYGSKSLVVEQVGSLVQSLSVYDSNVEVRTWGKVFRNELQEQVLYTILKTEDFMKSILHNYLRHSNDIETDYEIEASVL